jgi:hypothetical protein
MPLFTYVVTFKDVHYVVQGRHSNFQGFYNTWLDPFQGGTESTGRGREGTVEPRHVGSLRPSA